jgi:hypothetical protein
MVTVYLLDVEPGKTVCSKLPASVTLKKHENVSLASCMNTNLLKLDILIGHVQIFHVLVVYEKYLEGCERIMLKCVIWEFFLKM